MSVDPNAIRSVYTAAISRYTRLLHTLEEEVRTSYLRVERSRAAYHESQAMLADIRDARRDVLADYRREFPDAPLAVA